MTTSTDRRRRLLLVEDDPELAPIIRDVLGEVYEVETAASLAEGTAAALRDEVDVIVLDRRLGDGDGLDLVRRLRSARIAVPVLMLTALDAIADRVDGLDGGADDYLVKPFDFDELLARLRALTRSPVDTEPVIEIGAWEFYPRSRMISSPYSGRVVLTGKERDLLSLLVEHADRTLSRRRILAEVFGADGTPGVVDTYVHYLRRKTDRDLILTVRGEGYRLGRP